jgi:hypothetical protein
MSPAARRIRNGLLWAAFIAFVLALSGAYVLVLGRAGHG